MDRKQFEARIIAKAWRDPQFRQALKNDAKGTLAAELESLHSGAKLPDNLQISVLEESADHIYLVIPNNPAGVSGALDDASLAAVSGGAGGSGVTQAVTEVQVATLDTVAVVQVSGLDVVAQVGGFVVASGVVATR